MTVRDTAVTSTLPIALEQELLLVPLCIMLIQMCLLLIRSAVKTLCLLVMTDFYGFCNVGYLNQLLIFVHSNDTKSHFVFKMEGESVFIELEIYVQLLGLYCFFFIHKQYKRNAGYLYKCNLR